jgi:hypothetical protein
MSAGYLLLVYGDAREGRDAEYNEWYDRHVHEMTALPGVVSGKRFSAVDGVLASASPRPAPYLSVYELSVSPAELHAQIDAAFAAGEMTMSDSLDLGSVSMHFWAPFT